jgi:DNA-binding transcriptional LysR family regulator
MDVRQLRHFLAVAETLNYTRAAERLVMAASPLSRSIQQLELEVGGPLFIRGTRKVELTPLGDALVPHARKTISDLDALQRDMHRRVQGHVEFHVGMRSVPAELIAAVVDDVIKIVEPAAIVRLEPMDSFVQLDRVLNGRLTFGLINRRSDDRRLEYIAAMTERPAVALPNLPRYAALTEVRPEDLRGLRFLAQPGVLPFGPELTDIIDSVTEVVTMDFEIIGGLAAVIATGDSCCLTLENPGAPWHKYLAGDGVIIRPLADKSTTGTTYLAWRTDRDNPDDLGPIIQAARQRFPHPLDL